MADTDVRNSPHSYDGKAKRMIPQSDHALLMLFKDDATAFNGKKHALFDGKGALNCAITELLYDYLGAQGVPHHLIKRVDERSMFSRCVTGSRWLGLTQWRTRHRWSSSRPSGMRPIVSS